jgi:hypothetical protein
MSNSIKKQKNSGLQGIFREVFVSKNRELSPFGMVFVFEPENFDQKRLGTLFAVIKISNTSSESSFIVNLLVSVIKKEYFSKPDRPADASFEAALRKANLALAELARQGSVQWIGNINFAGGALEKNNLYFSKLGATSILLLRNGMIADIGEGIEDAPEVPNSHPLKTFSDISSGKVELNDCIIFATSDLLEIFSLEEIRQNAVRFSCDEFPEIITASLAANSELSGAIIVNILPGKAKAPAAEEARREPFFAPKRPSPLPPHPKITPAPSEPQKERDAEKHPQMDIFPSQLPESEKIQERSIYISEGDDIIPQKSFFEKISSVQKTAIEHTRNSFRYSRRKASNLTRLAGKIDWKKLSGSIKKVQPPKWSPNLGFLRKWNVKPQIFIGAAALIVVVVISLSWIRSKRNAPSQTETPSSENQTAAPPAGLNDANVKNIETISIVASIPTDSRELISLGDSLFLLSGDQTILKINPSNGDVISSESNLPASKFNLAAAMPDLNTIFIFTADKKVLSFSPSNRKFQENTITLPDNLNASDIKTYLTYLYFLDSSAGQIYRYPRAEGGFGDVQNWLKSDQDINGADKLAINDDIYVANNLNIIPLSQGKIDSAINFQKTQVPLRIAAIYTEPGFDHVYALDNVNHRVVQFGKDGQIVAQYFNESITDVNDFTVDEKNQTVYLENKDSISKFSME